jgi:hypothetical protein
MITGQPDTDADRDVYSQRLGHSAEFLNGGRSSAPNLSDFDASQYTTGSEPYPTWEAVIFQGDRRAAKSLPFTESLCGIWCVLNIAYHSILHQYLYIYSHHASISRFTCLTAVRRECLPTRNTLPFTRIRDVSQRDCEFQSPVGGGRRISASPRYCPRRHQATKHHLPSKRMAHNRL